MAFPVGLAIAGGASLLGGLFGGSAPKYNALTAAEINKLIDAYRQQGLEGIRTQGMRAQQQAASQLAASGLEPSLALQQSLYAPILQSLSSARTGLETGLAQTQADLELKNRMAAAGAQFQGDLTAQQNILGLLSGVGDIGGLLALQSSLGGGAQAPGISPIQQGINDFMYPQIPAQRPNVSPTPYQFQF